MAQEVKESGAGRRRRRGRTRLSAKNQATIPVEALRKAGLHPGDELDVVATGPGEVVLRRAASPLERYRGCLPAGTFPHGFLGRLREEWD